MATGFRDNARLLSAANSVFIAVLAASCVEDGPSDAGREAAGEDAGPTDAGEQCAGDPGCCCSGGDTRGEPTCIDGDWSCSPPFLPTDHHDKAVCDDPCAFDCANLAPLGRNCCDDAGTIVGSVSCSPDAGGLYCDPAGTWSWDACFGP